MNYTDFKKQLKDGFVFPAYLIQGEDAFFRKRALEELLSTLVEEKDMNFVTFSGENLDEDSLFSSLDMYPLMSKARITAVYEFYPDLEQIKKLNGFFSVEQKQSILVIINCKKSDFFDGTTNVITVDCDKADESLIKKWIIATTAKSNVSVNEGAIRKIIEYCLSDMTRIETEVSKLITFVGDGGNIDGETVDELVSKDSEYKIYEMTEAIGKKRFGEALNIISEMLSKGESHQKLIASVYNHFRRLLFVALSNKSKEETGSLLGIKAYAVSKLKEQAKYFKAVSLKKAVDSLVSADLSFKTGKFDVAEAFWLSIFKIMYGE